MTISPKTVWFDEGSMWVGLNEDISVEILLAGQDDLTKTPTKTA